MFKSKLGKTIGKIDGFIADLKAGIDQCAQKISDKDVAIDVENTLRAANIQKLEGEQNELLTELTAGEVLLSNLTKLTQGK